MKRRDPRSGGFSLIEVQLTLVVLLLGVLGLASAMVVAVRNQTSSRDRLVVARALANQMEVIGETDFDQILSTFNNTTTSITGCSSSAQIQVQVTSIDAHLLSVSLTGSWTGNSGTETLSLSQEFGQ